MDTAKELKNRIYYSDTVVLLPDGSVSAIDDVLVLTMLHQYCRFFRRSEALEVNSAELSEALLTMSAQRNLAITRCFEYVRFFYHRYASALSQMSTEKQSEYLGSPGTNGVRKSL